MRQYRIQGTNKPLAGELEVGGAKNAVLPILAAMCLNESITVIQNCPRIADTFVSIDILRCMGYDVEFVENTLITKPSNTFDCNIPDDCVGKMRSSILFMGAMLSRCGKISLALPGGCNLGNRAIDLHISGLKAMGAIIQADGNKLHCTAKKLKGARIHLHTPSVGATENLMIAASRASGTTIIENAAKEPEVVDLSLFLSGMGAKIKGAGTSTIFIDGVESLAQRMPHRIMPDRIVAGTYLVAAAITGGRLTLNNVNPVDILPTITRLIDMGCEISTRGEKVSLIAPPRLKPLEKLTTAVHPGFPTDMQAQFVSALATADGDSVVKETIFENRYQHATDLNKMGANITMQNDNRTFNIKGVKTLKGKKVKAQDLRGGAALILAALNAKGETTVQNAEYVERGYESIDRDLRSLGADIVLEEK